MIFGYLGAYHQDKRKVKAAGKGLAEFVSNTSIVPFVAIIIGRQKLKIGEISKVGLIVALIGAVVARIVHPEMRGTIFG